MRSQSLNEMTGWGTARLIYVRTRRTTHARTHLPIDLSGSSSTLEREFLRPEQQEKSVLQGASEAFQHSSPVLVTRRFTAGLGVLV